MKEDPFAKKKKKLPFHGKVGGGTSRRRADRKAGGGAVKRADGGPTGEEERSAGLKKLSGAMKTETSKSPGEARPFDNPRTTASNISRYVRPGLSEERGGFKKGGKVKKRAVGGETDCPPGGSSMPGTGPGAGGGFPASAPGGAMGNAIWNALTGPGGGIANFRPNMKKGGGVGKKDGGKLSAAQRQSLPKSDFALPGQGTGPKGAGSGSYPIPDESHARNALARSSGKPVAAAVRAKVKAKYPDIG